MPLRNGEGRLRAEAAAAAARKANVTGACEETEASPRQQLLPAASPSQSPLPLPSSPPSPQMSATRKATPASPPSTRIDEETVAFSRCSLAVAALPLAGLGPAGGRGGGRGGESIKNQGTIKKHRTTLPVCEDSNLLLGFQFLFQNEQMKK